MMLEWNVLIYAAGRNELETEICGAIEAIRNIELSANIHIAVQLARPSRKTIEAFGKQPCYRPFGCWDGVRRYSFLKGRILEIADLGEISMANPQTLADFIIWGVNSYPAERIMVILSGHSAGFIGAMLDYDHAAATMSMMNVGALAKALAVCQYKTGRQIDMLVFDTCFMNMVEIWHEFAIAQGQAVKHLIVPWGNAPRRGLPCNALIKLIQDEGIVQLPALMLVSKLVAKFNDSYSQYQRILAVNVEKEAFSRLKTAVDDLAGELLAYGISLYEGLAEWHKMWKGGQLISLAALAVLLSRKYPVLLPQTTAVYGALGEILTAPQLGQMPQVQNVGPAIFFPATNREYIEVQSYYDNLAFAAQNRWVKLLQFGQAVHQQTETSLPPVLENTVPVPDEVMLAFIRESQPGLSEEEARYIWHQLRNG